MANDELIGFHKGSLAKEREELLRIVNVTEQLMSVHLQALKDSGIDIASEVKQKNTGVKK